MFVGETDNAGTGVGAATLNVTVMVDGEPWTPVAVTVMCPVYVPAARLPNVAEACSDCGAVPLLGVTESHDESLLALKLRLPPPVFVTFTEDGAGFVPLPCVALNVSVDCETERMGLALLALP